jgi:hypothetical protein
MTEGSPMPITALIALAIFSNLYLGTVSPFSFFDATMQAPVLISDTAMVSAVLIVSRANQEFFLFFFFVLIMAAKIENLTVLAIAAVGIGFASLLFADFEAGFISPILMRVPFMLATALFYGYIVLPERTGQMSPLSNHGPRVVRANVRPRAQA